MGVKARVLRKVVKIDEAKCDGCGVCVPACAEGALKIIDGKARLVSVKYCDGLGACLGECPRGAITIEERQAEEFNEGEAKLSLHEKEYAAQAEEARFACGCPGSIVTQFALPERAELVPEETGCCRDSMLRHWPVQLTLVLPSAPFLQRADVVMAADCAPLPMAASITTSWKGTHYWWPALSWTILKLT